MIAPSCRLVTYIVMSLHPPYPVLVIAYIITGFGNGLEDAAWCAYIGNMANANSLQGLMQACTAMVTKAGLPWYSFYYVLVSNTSVSNLPCIRAYSVPGWLCSN